MLSMLGLTTNAFAGSRIALGRVNSLKMAVETTETLVEDRLGAASESGWTYSPGRDNDRERAREMLIELGGYDVESGIGPWDPLGLAMVTGDAMDTSARCALRRLILVHRLFKPDPAPHPLHGRLRWFRQAEIKHGRVSMTAFVGWVVSQNGLSWPGIEKAWVSSNPLETWGNTPWQYQWGFVLSCGVIEYRSLMGGWVVDPDGASLTKPNVKLGLAEVPCRMLPRAACCPGGGERAPPEL